MNSKNWTDNNDIQSTMIVNDHTRTDIQARPASRRRSEPTPVMTAWSS